MANRRKPIVEEGLTIDSAHGHLAAMRQRRTGALCWLDRDRRVHLSVSYALAVDDSYLDLTTLDRARARVSDRVSIRAVPQHWGGHRYWFACPGCDRGSRTLHWPGASPEHAQCDRHWRCRACHGLTYRSVRIHNQRRAELERDPDRLGRMLARPNNLRSYLRALKIMMSQLPDWSISDAYLRFPSIV